MNRAHASGAWSATFVARAFLGFAGFGMSLVYCGALRVAGTACIGVALV